MSTTTIQDSELSEARRRWRTALAAADTGPLVIAKEVVAFAARWSELPEEDTEGLEPTGWLRKYLGNGKTLAYFAQRARAVDKLGPSVRGKVHHEVAVWVHNKIPANSDKLQEVVFALLRARNANGGNAISLRQAEPIVFSIIGRPQAPKRLTQCERCKKLEAILRKHDIPFD